MLRLLYHIMSAPLGENCHFPYFVNEETEAQRGSFLPKHTASKSQSWDSGWGGLPSGALSHSALLKYGLMLNQREPWMLG